jgi:hypothetical protein
MTVSPAIEKEIRSRGAWLESFYPTVVGCRVLLEEPHRQRGDLKTSVFVS